MKLRPVAFIFQPRLHSVTGQHVSSERLRQTRRHARRHATRLIIEDDGVATFPRLRVIRSVAGLRTGRSTSSPIRKRMVRICRLAVLSSSRAIVEQIQSYR